MDISSKPGSTTKNKTGGWRSYKAVIDYNKCIGCGVCAKVCPESCIAMYDENGKKRPKIDYSYCKGCGLCAAECPVNAISMELEEEEK